MLEDGIDFFDPFSNQQVVWHRVKKGPG